ncbi:MAG: GNAT family N-acetyltransferase [Saccharospirillum sp.]|nr:GNAT family N-acetyltransferase [Saccharospirillum sp.]
MPASLVEDQALIEERQPTLFQTTAWEQAWLETWGQQGSKSSNIRLDHKSHSYHLTRRFKGWLPIPTATTIGCSERSLPSIRREYYQASIRQITAQLDDTKGQRLFSDVILGSPTYHHIKSLAQQQGLLVLEQDHTLAYSVDTNTKDYPTYLDQLSANTRLKLHNRRKRLHGSGTVTQNDLWPDVSTFIEQLNDFHQKRWGKPCYEGMNLAFIKRLLPLLNDEGHGVRLNCLTVDGKPVSLLLDIEVGQRVYNLQSGYKEQYRPGLSLGTLHFGYRIEHAFKSTHIQAYDFMAGEGKNSNYKASLATQQCQLVSLIAVKPLWLKCLYWLKNPNR